MIIRPATESDIPQITTIYARSVREEIVSFELEPPDETEMLHRMQGLLANDYPYLVAEKDGEIAGYVYASVHRPRPAYAKTVESTVYVDPSFWRQGIARALLVALIEKCQQQQFRQMIAIAACDPDADLSEIPSVQLHLALGFVESGRLKAVGYKHDKWLDIVLMQRAVQIS
mgnify:CR=1 FL=1